MQTAVVGGAAAAATALVSFGVKSVGRFTEATAQVRQFKNVPGATA